MRWIYRRRTVAVLTLLDLSAAFNTVGHVTLLRLLKTSYGIGGSVLEWFTSYLSGRIQSVRCGMSTSDASAVKVRKRIYIAPLLKYLTLKALRYGSHRHRTCKLHRTCLYLVSIHQMAHPRLRLRTSNCSLLLIYLPERMKC